MSASPGAIQIREREVPATAQGLALSMSPRIARVFAARGVSCVDDVDLRLKALRAPEALPGLALAAKRLALAIVRNERLLVVGDFDADGATGTAVAVRGLRMLGARFVDFAVPDRKRHGYGLSTLLVDELLDRAPQVIVTVDHGTSSVAGVARAASAGIDVVITDHHLPGPELPAAHALVNPNAWGVAHPLAALAGVGVVFHVLAAVRAALAELGAPKEVQLASLLDLVALGTVADLVPLDRTNRILVAEGLRRIQAGRACAGIRALLESAGRDPARLSASDLGFQIGPRLNAAGRLDDMGIGIRCLITDDPDEARELATQLSELNRERRGLQADMEQAATMIVARILSERQGQIPAGIVVADPGWHAGVVGLVASRVAERLHRPTLALAPVEEGASEWRGSGRSVSGFHLRDALVELDCHHPGLMTRFGGHAMAAGLSFDSSQLSALAPAFEAVSERLLDADLRTRVVWTDGPLDTHEFNFELARLIETSGPFGQAFPEPLFDNQFELLERRVLKAKHLKLRLRSVGQTRGLIEAIWFSAPAEMLDHTPARLRLLYQLNVERWQGMESAVLLVRYGFAG